MGLDRKRLVLVEGAGQGTGYVIGHRVVLTAAHAVDPDRPTVVSLIRSPRGYSATVIWRRHDEQVDAALLRIDDPAWPDDVPGTPVRWGRLATLRPNATWTALAFPVGYRDKAGELDVAQLSGRVNPGDKLLSRRLSLRIDGVPPQAPGESPWAGASGSALFVGDLLSGVVTLDPGPWGSRRLEAVPVTLLIEDEAFRTALGGTPLIEAAEAQELAIAPRTRQPRSVADLLHPDAALIPFHGPAREHTLPEILRWCEADELVAAGLLSGPGGRGKTRFAAELSRWLAGLGWTVVDLRRPGLVASPDLYAVLGEFTTPTLVVVDYAETRAEQVEILLRGLAPAERVRVLLLARSAGEWWENLSGQLPGRTTVWEVPVLAGSPGERETEYRVAVAHLAQGLKHLPAHRETDWDAVSASVAGSPGAMPDGGPLTVHMAALTGLLNAVSPPGGAAGSPLEEQVIAHERTYWEDSTRTAGLLSGQGAFGPFRPSVLRLFVAATVLTRPESKTEARDLLASVPGLAGEQRESDRISVAEWLHGIYPPRQRHYWGTLEPDRLGEYLLGLTIREEPDFLRRVLPVLDGQDVEHALTVLSRVAGHEVHRRVTIERLEDLYAEEHGRIAATAVTVATQTEHPEHIIESLERFAGSERATAEVLGTISRAVPGRSHVLEGFAAGVSARRVQLLDERLGRPCGGRRLRRRQVWSAPEDYSALMVALDTLAVRRAALGYETEALEYSKEAVRIGGLLPPTTDNVIRLANVFHNYANRLDNLGRTEEAVRTGRRAVTLYRTVLRQDPVEVWPALAGALHNQVPRLDALGRTRRALAALSESVDIHRTLAGIAASFEPALAGALINQFIYLSKHGEHDKALDVIVESEQMFRRLSDRSPDAYLSSLADVLHNKAIGLMELRRPDEALAAVDAALDISESILERYPDSYVPTLQRSWVLRATILSELGDRDAVIQALEVSVDVASDLIRRYPQETVADFMATMTNAARLLNDLELYDDSRWCVEEALAAYAEIARDNRDAGTMILNMQDLLLFHHERDPGGGRVVVEKNGRRGFTYHLRAVEPEPGDDAPDDASDGASDGASDDAPAEEQAPT
ncbi:MAG TPA: tetratricopeptide repeat-containing serine protease family protein [Nonomuraea sp.]|nr:tetratricopeptide repeat-containing serine protease family protein [Nonomuraea sp.]